MPIWPPANSNHIEFQASAKLFCFSSKDMDSRTCILVPLDELRLRDKLETSRARSPGCFNPVSYSHDLPV